MINRRHTKEREGNSCSQTLRLRTSMVSLLTVLYAVAILATNGALAQQYGTRGNAAQSTDEDLQVKFCVYPKGFGSHLIGCAIFHCVCCCMGKSLRAPVQSHASLLCASWEGFRRWNSQPNPIGECDCVLNWLSSTGENKLGGEEQAERLSTGVWL